MVKMSVNWRLKFKILKTLNSLIYLMSILVSVSRTTAMLFTCKGRLKKNVTFREQIRASSWILNILKEGYSLFFVELPPKIFFKNNRSALKSADFVTLEVFKVLVQGCIREIVKRNDRLLLAE